MVRIVEGSEVFEKGSLELSAAFAAYMGDSPIKGSVAPGSNAEPLLGAMEMMGVEKRLSAAGVFSIEPTPDRPTHSADLGPDAVKLNTASPKSIPVRASMPQVH